MELDFVFRRNGRVHLNRWGTSVQSTTGSRGVRISGSNAGYTRCGNKETGLLLLLISGHVDDEEEGRALTRGLPSTMLIHAHRLVWP